MREVLDGLCGHAGTGSRTIGVPKSVAQVLMKLTSDLGISPLAPYHTLMYGESFWFDITRTREELGWVPKYSNDAMFRESYDWFVQHRGHLMKDHSHHRSSLSPRVLNLLKRFL